MRILILFIRGAVKRLSKRGPTRPGKKNNSLGWQPRYEDIDWSGRDFSRERFEELQRVDYSSWRREVLEHEELFRDLHDHLPKELVCERDLLICRLRGAR